MILWRQRGGVYYNENNKFAAGWLRWLIERGQIPDGEVDERSIVDVDAMDLHGFVSCHWFAGISGWSRALRMAGVPDDFSVWTGSCPCQPFSVAGKQQGFADERHLWPVWERLIEKRRPHLVFGEQTARAPAWLALVRGDLERMDYAVGICPVEAASAGAYHFRDRYWFVAHRDGVGSQVPLGFGGDAGAQFPTFAGNGVRDVPDSDGSEWRPTQPRGHDADRSAAGRQESDGGCAGRCRGDVEYDQSIGWGEGWTESELRSWGPAATVASIDGVQVIECPDGKWRRLPPPRVRWLGTGIPSRVDLLRGFGNAIDIRPATAFIKAALGAIRETI